jgi:hypothetical protein
MRWRRYLLPLLVLAALAARGATGPAGIWERYEEEGGCIGGSRCGDQGDAIRIPLEDAPVLGIRFHARDDVGDTRGGHLRIRIDKATVVPDVDVADAGELYEFPLDGRRGRFLLIETRTDDEAVVEDIEIRYAGLKAPRERREWKPYPESSGCIGGERCGDQGRAIHLPLEDASVWGVRFLAHDNVGPRTRGHLRVRIDRRTLARDIDVPRAGEVYTLQVEGVRGHALVFEAIGNDEVVVQDIEVQYAGLRDPLARPFTPQPLSPGPPPTLPGREGLQDPF